MRVKRGMYFRNGIWYDIRKLVHQLRPEKFKLNTKMHGSKDKTVNRNINWPLIISFWPSSWILRKPTKVAHILLTSTNRV